MLNSKLSTPQWGFHHQTVHTFVEMKSLKAALYEQNEAKSSGVGKGMRRKNYKPKRRQYVHCQSVIFWFSAVVLVVLFIQQVRNEISLYYFYIHVKIFKMTRCLMKYVEEPTYISSRIVDQWEADLPAITVCPNTNKIKTEVLQV